MACVFRAAEPRGYNGDNITLVNYVVCVALSLVSALSSGSIGALGELPRANLAALFSEKSPANTAVIALIFGAVSGFLYLATLTFSRRSYISNGVGITIMFEKCAFLIPILAALVLWGQLPTAMQVAGIVLATAAIIMNVTGTGDSRLSNVGMLGVCFCMSGLIEVGSNAFVVYAFDSSYQSLFVLCIFTTALILCFAYVLGRCRSQGQRLRITPREALAGVAAGLPNVATSFFQLRCLESLPAAVVFPCMAGGNLVLITVLSRLIFREKLTRRQLVSAGVTLLGLVLVNL